MADCNDDATHILRQAGYPVKRVIRTEPDCVLWVDRFDKAKTSYIQAKERNGKWSCKVITTVPGFVA